MPVFEVNSDTKNRKAVAVRFSNGALNSKDQSRVKFKCYAKKETRSKTTDTPSCRHIVTAEADGMIYVGKTFGPENRFPTENCDYYFGVHDKKTGKIQVISAELCHLEPLIEDTRKVEDDNSKKTYREKHDALAKEFGSGRTQRAVNKRLNNQLEDEMVSVTTKAVVESSHTQQQAAELTEPVKTEASAIPPYNKDATIPDDVYKVKDIISSEVLESMSFKSEPFYKSTAENIAEWRTKKLYSSFVLSKLETMSLREDARRLQSQYLMYLQFLMNVFLMKSKDLGRKFPLPSDWPAPVKNHILNSFTLEINQAGAGKRYQRCAPGRLKDLLLSHILILCLKLSQFDLALAPLMNDLNLSHKRITTHATSLGCTIKKIKGPQGEIVFKAVLTVPLTFPKVKEKRAKKRIF